jgi:hypothetical protein
LVRRHIAAVLKYKRAECPLTISGRNAHAPWSDTKTALITNLSGTDLFSASGELQPLNHWRPLRELISKFSVKAVKFSISVVKFFIFPGNADTLSASSVKVRFS